MNLREQIFTKFLSVVIQNCTQRLHVYFYLFAANCRKDAATGYPYPCCVRLKAFFTGVRRKRKYIIIDFQLPLSFFPLLFTNGQQCGHCFDRCRLGGIVLTLMSHFQHVVCVLGNKADKSADAFYNSLILLWV